MPSIKLANILRELGRTKFLPISDLAPDQNNACLIRLPGGVDFQMESDKEERNLVIGCKFNDIPVGRYRETLFREALRANGQSYPRYGIFGYNPRTNQLILFDMLNYNDLTGDKVADYLEKFVEKAGTWRTAIANGEIPTQTFRSSGGGIFGLIR